MLQISETFESGAGTTGLDSSDTLIAYVWGDPNPATDNADNEYVAVSYALGKFPLVSLLGNVFTNLARKRTDVPGRWEMTGQYKSSTENRQTNDAAFSFNTGGGSQHITHSRKTVATYIQDSADDSSGPDFQQGINVGPNGAEGIDIGVASFDFKTTFYISPANMTAAYVDTCKSLTARVNKVAMTINIDGVMLTFQPGELRLLGVEGSKRHGISDWELSASWSAIPNESNLSIGTISDIQKNGWDYLWVYTSPTVDTDSNTLIHQPTAAYVEQVYDYEDLNPILQSTSFGQGNAQPWTSFGIVAGGGL